MNKLLDAVASRLQRKRVLKKMPAWSLAALYWAWPGDGLEGSREALIIADPKSQVDRRIAKREFTYRMLERTRWPLTGPAYGFCTCGDRSWMGPKEWRRRIDSSVKIPA
eukprot:Skav226683  [mRNA]  locus=scaffold3971:36886:37966:- [translate_table: standard]